MTPQQIDLVQKSFAQVQPIADAAADLFYGRLFELDPSLRPMFRGDMKQQGRMLMSVLGIAVNGLRNLETLAPVVRKLGARHTGYGVKTLPAIREALEQREWQEASAQVERVAHTLAGFADEVQKAADVLAPSQSSF